MGQVGFQDYWVAGSRLYFQRDAVAGVAQPWLDLGTIATANPEIAPTQVELLDPDGGISSRVDVGITQVTETYDVQSSNINLENLALLFFANSPETFSQSSGNFFAGSGANYAHPERLLKIVDDDANNTKVYGLERVYLIALGGDRITTTAGLVTAMSASAKTITTSSDISGSLAVGDGFAVQRSGLTNPENSRTYKIKSVSGVTITVDDEDVIASNESSITVGGTYENTGGSTGKVLLQKVGAGETGRDWELASKERGIVRFLSSATKFTTALNPTGASVDISGWFDAISSAKRLFKPQSAQGVITGSAVLVWSRRNNSEQTVREMRVSVSPSGSNLQDQDFSNITLQFSVLQDVGSEDPAGRILQFAGGVPPQS